MNSWKNSLLKYCIVFVLTVIICPYGEAENHSLPQFKQSTGNLFQLKFGSIQSDIILAVISSDKEKLVIEINSRISSSLIPIEMTQQFHLKIRDKKVYIAEAYISAPILGKNIYRLDDEYLQGYDRVQMASFLNFKPNGKFKKIAKAKVKTDSGDFQSTHYQMKENSQSIDFWIVENIKPFAIAAIRSTGPKKNQNYMLSYKEPVKAYRSKMDISKAKNMDDKIKAVLPKPSKSKHFLLP